MRFEVKFCSVLDAGADIVVNAANNYLSCGGGVCGAIFQKAGVELLEEECKQFGFVKTGSAVITNGFNSGAKYIIHAVGPSICEDKDDWREKLASAYRNSLIIADKTNENSVAFPCISTGIFGCPFNESTHIALNEVANFDAKNLEVCYLCCFNEYEYKIYNKLSYLYNFRNFIDYTKNSIESILNEDVCREKTNVFLKELMQFEWEDIILVPKESLFNIYSGWIYDWIHCTANYDKQALVKELYKKYELPILSAKQYLDVMTSKYNSIFKSM